MVKGISVKNNELFELVRGASLTGVDVDDAVQETAAILKQKLTEKIGNDMDVVLQASESEIAGKIAELKERAAVVAKMRKEA